jgi:predicted ArsR family transcriptional regulator
MLKLIINNDEPRILDTDLAEALGMSRPRDIRSNLIVPNKEELETYGILRSSNANSGKRGRPSWVYHLNKDQALLVAILSRVPKAAEVRAEVIKVFNAYQKGHLELSDTGKSALPNFANPADAARAWAEVWEQGQKDRVTVAEHLETLTINEFFALNHQYGTMPDKTRLSARARKLCNARGILVGKQDRVTTDGYETQVNVYPLKELMEAAKDLGMCTDPLDRLVSA